MRAKVIVGALLLFGGLATGISSEDFLRQSSDFPVDIPISNSQTHIRTRFVSWSRRYRIGIGFAHAEKLSFAKPDCIPSPDYPASDCIGIAWEHMK